MKISSLITCLLAAPLLIGGASAQTISISTTPSGSFTNSAGAAMAKVISDNTKLHAIIQAQAMQGHIPVNAGTADFGMANSFDLTFYYNGTGDYEKQGEHHNLRLIGSLIPYRVAMHVKADSNIKTLEDLKGKTLPSGFNAQKTIKRIISAYLANAGLTYNDVQTVLTPNVKSSADDFIAGKIDAFMFAIGSGIVKQASAKVGGLRVLPINDSPEAMARVDKILPGSYVLTVKPSPHLEGITEPTKLIAFDMVFFANPKMSDDVVYRVTKALHEHKDDLAKAFRPFGMFDLKQMAKPVANVPFHPGAIKYYKEIGLMK